MPTSPDPAPGEPQRLSKVVAALKQCSRREAEQYIAEGWVRVDGARVEEPFFRVAPMQRVEIDPAARLQRPVHATLLLHKPAGMRSEDAASLLRPDTQWEGDNSGIRHVKTHATGLQEMLPLPADASGLVVFSQDEGVVRKLTEDAAFIEQELVAEVTGTAAPDALARMGRAIVPEGKPPARVSWQSEHRLRVAAKGIALERVAHACEQAGLQLVALRRIRIGRVPMAALPPGQWRYLPPGERF